MCMYIYIYIYICAKKSQEHVIHIFTSSQKEIESADHRALSCIELHTHLQGSEEHTEQLIQRRLKRKKIINKLR